MRRFICLVCISFSASSVFAQSYDIRQAIADGNYKRALKLAEDSEADPKHKKDPEVYFLKAEAIYELMKDPFYLKKNPESLKIGMKALEKGKSRNNNELLEDYQELVDQYVELNDVLALNDFKVNRYGQSISNFTKSYELNGNKISYFWAGKSYIYNTDTASGEKIYKEIIHYCNEQNANGVKVDKQLEEPYTYFADKYWTKGAFDSANVFLVSARKIFGGNPKIDYYQKEIAKQQIELLPPSNLMMEVLNQALFYFPTDSFFVKKQNALYLFMMRNYIDLQDSAKLDTMLVGFSKQKLERSTGSNKAFYAKHDQFLDTKTENVIWKLVAYYGKYQHVAASNYLCDKYIRMTAVSTKPEDIRKRYVVIVDYAAKSKSLELASQILNGAIARYGTNPEYVALQNSLISQNLKKPLGTDDQLALYRLLLTKETNLAKISEDFQLVTVNLVDALIKDQRYIEVKKILLRHQKAQPTNPIWDKKLIVLAKEDFFHNYYKTRIKEEEVAGMIVPGFEWNGTLMQCQSGDIDSATQQKVEDRVNYFRRQAGVPEIFLDQQLNDWCQKAALMMEANKMMNHSPKANWSCYSDEGAEACKYSLLTKGANTTMAVTSFFADNKNPSVGNRRWLLYPNAKALGHGSSTNYCALWALDDSGNVDTNTFKEKFISWPPEGIIPQMMVFDHWSFTLDQDLKDVKVEVSENGKVVPIEILPLVEGYGLPTVVWKLKEEKIEATSDRDLKIVVTLKSGRKYSYAVHILNFDPIGY